MSYGKHFVALYTEILERTDLNSDEKIMLATVYKWHTWFGKTPKPYSPTNGQLAKSVGLDVPTVCKVLTSLFRMGEIDFTYDANNNRIIAITDKENN